MHGVDDAANVVADSHRSADDLNDGFILDDDDRKRKKVGFTLAYKDGKAIANEVEDEDVEMKQDEAKAEEGNNNDEEEDDDEDEDEEEDEDDEEGYSDMDDESDGSDGGDDDEDDDEEEEAAPKTTSKKGILKRSGSSDVTSAAVAAKREIPYTFTMPSSLTELDELLRPFSVKEQVQIDRI